MNTAEQRHLRIAGANDEAPDLDSLDFLDESASFNEGRLRQELVGPEPQAKDLRHS